LEGRDFTERDEKGAPLVMIVSQTFARRYFAGATPLGRQIRLEDNVITVVGMVKDIKYHTAMEGPLPFFYMPFRQRFAPGLNFSVLVRTKGDALRIIPILEREALALNPDATCHSRLYTEAATASLYSQRVAATLLGVVGSVCLLLAAIGLYSVMSHAVGQRTHELGIRMALGARPAQVCGLVVRDGLRLASVGLAAGLAGAVVASRLVSGMLFRVSAADPLTFVAAASLLAAVAGVASYVPALRATRVDPMRALRCD
jgi:predicted lysophospholipase L1 biosynthesis ABC-type transport system permease subunit